MKYECVSVESRIFEEIGTVKLNAKNPIHKIFFFLTYGSEYEVDSERCRSVKIVVDMLGVHRILVRCGQNFLPETLKCGRRPHCPPPCDRLWTLYSKILG